MSDLINIFSGCPSGRTATIVLRGGADQFIEEAERSLHDANNHSTPLINWEVTTLQELSQSLHLESKKARQELDPKRATLFLQRLCAKK